MDDTKNGRYSRGPELSDLLTLCKALAAQNVSYVLIGGFAVMLHGFRRTTKDIDLMIDPSEDNVRRLKKAMSVLPDNAIRLIEDNEVQQYQVVRIADEVVVDLMASACGINYEEAKNHIEWKEIDGIRIPVADKKLLIRTKDTLRPSDKMDVDFLSAQLAEEKK